MAVKDDVYQEKPQFRRLDIAFRKVGQAVALGSVQSYLRLAGVALGMPLPTPFFIKSVDRVDSIDTL